MSRISPEDLKEVFSTTLSDTAIQIFINSASGIVDSLTGLSEALLENIELFLTAHFISCSVEKEVISEKIGQVQVNYQQTNNNQVMGLKTTSYGRIAIALDTTGKLAEIGLRRATIEVFDTLMDE